MNQNPFDMTPEDLEKLILDHFMQTRESEGAITWSREPFRYSSNGSQILTFKVTYANGAEKYLLLRGSFVGLNPGTAIGEHINAHWTASLLDLPVAAPILCGYDTVISGEAGGSRRKQVVVPFPETLPGSLVFSVQEYFPDTFPLADYFKALRIQAKLTKRDDHVINLISKGFEQLHCHRTVKLAFKEQTAVVLDALPPEMLDRIYNDSLDDVATQFQRYLGTDLNHPVFYGERRAQVRNFLDNLLFSCRNKRERLVVTIGDAHTMNLLLRVQSGAYTHLYFIDAHRRMSLADRAYDFGRIKSDCLEWAMLTGNDIYLQWVDRLFDVHEERIGDTELGVASNVGMVSRLGWKSCTKNKRNKICVADAPEPESPQFNPEHCLNLYKAVSSFVIGNRRRFC